MNTGGQSQRDQQREQTDESLRVERDKADANVAEQDADEVVRIARERADQVVQTARDVVDREHGPESRGAAAVADGERARADARLVRERAAADDDLEQERAQRRRYLADFLSTERDATDRDLVDERAQADAVVAARDEFLATVSHDLRGLLSGLSLSAGVLVKLAPDDPSGDKLREAAARTKRLVVRMNRLINDLLDVASIEAGKLALIPEPIEIAGILREALEAFEPMAAAKGITLDVADGGRAEVRADGGRILQVLANLVSNAIKFTPAKGRISMSLRSDENEMEIAVRDTGIGVPADALEDVFAPFHQIARHRGGLGLGLHISKSIVEGHGGRMWAESQLGAGSTFRFTLPTLPTAAVDEARDTGR